MVGAEDDCRGTLGGALVRGNHSGTASCSAEQVPGGQRKTAHHNECVCAGNRC